MKEQAERDRVDNLRTAIAAIIDDVNAEPFNAVAFAEFADEAQQVHDAALEYTDTYNAKLLAEERAEADRIAREARDRQESEARAAREAADARAAAERTERDRIAREEREREEAAAETARAERDRFERVVAEAAEAARVAEEKRVADEAAEAKRKAEEATRAHAEQVRGALQALTADPLVKAFVDLALTYRAAENGIAEMEALAALTGCFAEAIGAMPAPKSRVRRIAAQPAVRP